MVVVKHLSFNFDKKLVLLITINDVFNNVFNSTAFIP